VGAFLGAAFLVGGFCREPFLLFLDYHEGGHGRYWAFAFWSGFLHWAQVLLEPFWGRAFATVGFVGALPEDARGCLGVDFHFYFRLGGEFL